MFRSAHYPRPQTIAPDFVRRVLFIPNNREIIAAVSDVLAYLTHEYVFDSDTEESEDVEIRAALTQMVYSYFESVYPMTNFIGEIKPFLTDTLPDGVLLCDGSQYNEVDYPELYAALPASFKSAGTFTVPNLTGRALIGAGGVYALGGIGGEATHSLTIDEMPAHAHIVDAHNHSIPAHGHTSNPHTHTQASHNHEVVVRENSAIGSLASVATSTNAGTFTTRLTGGATPTINAETVTINNAPETVSGSASPATNSRGGGGSHNNMQPYLVVKYGIVAR